MGMRELGGGFFVGAVLW